MGPESPHEKNLDPIFIFVFNLVKMILDRKKNAIRNIYWGLLQKIVNTFFPFVVRTCLIYSLGAQYAGLSSLFTSILQILNLAELGFSNAIVYSMYKPIANNDKNRICSLLGLYRKAYFFIGLVILIIGFLLFPFLHCFIKGDVPADTNIYILFFIYLINNVISYFFYGYKTSLLFAFQRVDVISKNLLLCNVLLYTCQCCIVLMYSNYYAFVIIIPVVTIFLNILNNISVSAMFPDYLPKGEVSFAEKEELKKNLIGIMIWKIGGASRNTIDCIVISSYLGLVMVTVYDNYFFVLSGINSLLSIFITSISAGVGNKIASDTPNNNYNDFRRFHFYFMWIAGVCCVFLVCLYQPFMKEWMGTELMLPNHVMFMFCYIFIMMKQGEIYSVYYQASGLWWKGKLTSIIEAALNLFLNVILGKLFGISGILLSTIIAFTFGAYFYGSKFVFKEYFKNDKLFSYFLENIFILSVITFSCFISFFLTNIITINLSEKFRFIFIVFICFIVSNSIFFTIYSTNNRYRKYIKCLIGLVNTKLRNIR